MSGLESGVLRDHERFELNYRTSLASAGLYAGAAVGSVMTGGAAAPWLLGGAAALSNGLRAANDRGYNVSLRDAPDIMTQMALGATQGGRLPLFVAGGAATALYGHITGNDRLTYEGIFQSGLGVAGAGLAKLFSQTNNIVKSFDKSYNIDNIGKVSVEGASSTGAYKKSFPEVIHTFFSRTEVQLCVV